MKSNNFDFYKCVGIITGAASGFISTFLGLVLVACAEDDNSKIEWKKYTKYTIIGWLSVIVIICCSFVVHLILGFNITSFSYIRPFANSCHSNTDCINNQYCDNGSCS